MGYTIFRHTHVYPVDAIFGSFGHSQQVPSTFPEMFLFNAAVMGFSESSSATNGFCDARIFGSSVVPLEKKNVWNVNEHNEATVEKSLFPILERSHALTVLR